MKVSKSLLLSIFICFAANTPSIATMHIIEFGGSLGDTFAPNTLTVSTGDTIKWVGSFSFHPLQSTAVPANAQAFGPISSGSSFIYVVTVVGDYAYQCNTHASLGMTGTFSATAQSDVSQSLTDVFSLNQNYPNPCSSTTTFSYTLDHSSEVSLKVFDCSGKEIRNINNGFQNPGKYEISFNTNGFTEGAYFYQLQAEEAVLTRQMIVLKK